MPRRLPTWSVITWSFLSAGVGGCGSSSPKGEPTAPTATSTAPTSDPPAPSSPAGSPSGAASAGVLGAVAVQGRWTSPSCGARKYVRNLDVGMDSRFKAEDRVSPCPPNVACVWSGIVEREGIWSFEGGRLTLATDKDRDPPKQGAPFPGTLELSGTDLVEVQGGERCLYARP